jgi:hypothetical protein
VRKYPKILVRGIHMPQILSAVCIAEAAHSDYFPGSQSQKTLEGQDAQPTAYDH